MHTQRANSNYKFVRSAFDVRILLDWNVHVHRGHLSIYTCFNLQSASQHLTTREQQTETSGYATWFTAGGAIRIAHYDVIDDVITRKL